MALMKTSSGAKEALLANAFPKATFTLWFWASLLASLGDIIIRKDPLNILTRPEVLSTIGDVKAR